jgi:hypothetical protein
MTAKETTMRDQTLSENFALELMREGKVLMRMHTVNGMRWFIVPGGKITDSVANRILARPDVQPHDSGLFPGCEQTFKLRGDWRAPPRLTASCMSTGKRPRARSMQRPTNRMEVKMGNRSTYAYGQSEYLRADDWAGKSQRVIIAAVDDVEFERGLKPVLTLKGLDKKLVVNATNFDILMDAFGNNTDKWVGHSIVLEGTKISFKGKRVDSVRVSVPKQAAKPVQEEPEDPPFDDDMLAAG